MAVSASWKRLIANFKHTGLLGRAAIGQDAGLVIKSLLAVVLNGSVLKLVCHGEWGPRTFFCTEQKLLITFAAAPPRQFFIIH